MDLRAFRLSDPEWTQRSQGIDQGLQENGSQALLVYGTGHHSFLLPDYVMYACGFLGAGDHSFLLLIPGEQPELFVGEPADLARAEAVAWMATVTFAPDPAVAAAERVRRRGLHRLTLAGRHWMPLAVLTTLTGTLGHEVAMQSGDALLDRMARIKGPDELARVRKAAAIADAGFSALLAAARPGVCDYELAAEVDYVMKSMGAHDNFGMVSAGAHNHAGHPPVGHRLAAGDLILAELTPAFGGYFAQICRTIVVGDLKPEHKRDAALLHRVYAAAVAAIRPGQPGSVVPRTMNQIMDEVGYGLYSRPPHMRSRGHGMGFGSLAPGELTEDNDTIFEAGMAFIVHPNQYFPDSGYLLLGDMVEVVADGARSLMQTPAQVFTV